MVTENNTSPNSTKILQVHQRKDNKIMLKQEKEMISGGDSKSQPIVCSGCTLRGCIDPLIWIFVWIEFVN